MRIRFKFYFSLPDTDSGSKKSAKIMENSHKNQPKSWKIHNKSTKIMENSHKINQNHMNITFL